MEVSVRPLAEPDLEEADRTYRLAFGTFFGLPNPRAFGGDSDGVRGRWLADPAATLGAYSANRLVGSNFAANWGSAAYFGPLTVHPDFWNQGVAKKLIGPTLTFSTVGELSIKVYIPFPIAQGTWDSTKHLAFGPGF
jgi:GNAT superfamily N-acetyltransferase